MLRKLLSTAMFILGFVTFAVAQNGTVTGTVTDASSGESLPGVNVVITEIQKGASSDANGNYTISNVPSGTYTIRATFVGYKEYTKQITVGSGETITQNIKLASDILGLDEVVVTGYATTTKEKSSVSVQSVGSEDIEARPNVSVTQRLSGQVAGLNIASSTGQPGGDTDINLRGVSSLNGNTEPLFILDGTPVNEDNFRSLDPDEIANVTVLKDAGATAIYGNRGANGVVVIETKQGSYNTGLQVEYSGQVKTSSLQETDYDMMSGPEQLRLEKSLGRGVGSTMTDEEIDNAETTDWVDFFFDPSVSTSHSLRLSTGQENISTMTSIGYTSQDGALAQSSLKRYNLRNNITGRSDNERFNYSVNTSINFSDNEEPNNIGSGAVNRNTILGAFSSVPYVTPDDYVDGASIGAPNFYKTPLFIMDRLETFKRTENEVKLIGSANASYEITNNLVVNTTIGADYQKEERIRSEGPNSFNALLFAQTGNTTPGFQQFVNTETLNYNLNTNIKYQKQLNEDHSIEAAAYMEVSQAFYNFDSFFQEGLDPKTFSHGDGSGYVSDNSANDFFSNDVSSDKLQAGLFSYFGTLGYDYKSRYGVDLTVRRDASYRFSESNRWGTFYSVGARWNINNEPFMEDVELIDVLKLRGSFGKTGNQEIVNANGQFKYFSAADLTQSLFATGVGYGSQNSLFLSQIGNSDLKWETIYQTNIGVDFEMFNSRLKGSFDAYLKKTEDLFQNRPISAVNGQTSIRANIGSLENRGLDFQVEYDFLRSKRGLNLTLGVVGNYNKQELLDIPTPEGQVIQGNYTGIREGGVIGEYYVIPYIGVNPDNGNLLFLDKDGNVTENPNPATDRRWTGENIYPDVSGSFNLDVSYKGLSLNTQWTYTLGVKRLDFDYEGFINPNNIGAFRTSTDILNNWTPNNTDAPLPSYNASNRGLDDFSDRFLENSDYLRLRYVSLGYEIPQRYLQKISLRGASVFVSAENLLTFTEWKGYDAETQDPFASRDYPNPRIITAGIEIQL